MTKKKIIDGLKPTYNYRVIFAGQMSEGTAQFMTEKMARTFMAHILENAKLNDIMFSVKRLTPEPVIWAGTDLGTNTVTGTDTLTFTGGTGFNTDPQ